MRIGMFWIAAAFVALAVVAACGDDDDEATPTPNVCDQADAVRESVQAVGDIDVLSEGTDALSAAVDEVRTDLQALAGGVSDALAPDVDALTSAVDDARDVLSDITDDSSLNEKIDSVQEALTGIATAWSDLETAVSDAGCD
jgi:uncharacterized phage infection (PIP) family protein YhgE